MLMIYIVNASNPNEVWEMPTNSVKWSEELNAVSTGSFSASFIALNNLAKAIGTNPFYILAGGPRKILIKDEQYDNPYLFQGWVTNIQFSSSRSEVSSITVNFADPLCMLSKRVGQNFAFYDQVASGLIFKTELDYCQGQENGDLGITLATLPATTSRQRTVERTNMLDLLIGMSAAKNWDGYDFWLDHTNWTLNIGTKGSHKPELVLEERNSMNSQLNIALKSRLANRVIVQGGEMRDGDGEVVQEPIQVIRENTSSQPIWGLHEEYISATDIATEPFLNARGDTVLADRALPLYTQNITLSCLGDDPNWRDYTTGDWLQVILPKFQINAEYRVKKRSISHTNGVFTLGLTFNDE